MEDINRLLKTIKEYNKKYTITEDSSEADKLIEKIPMASFSNVLSIANRINFDGKEPEKFDLSVFIRTLIWLSGVKILNSDNPYYQEVYKTVNDLSNNL